MTENKTNKMGTMEIPKLILNMSIPMILSMVFQAFYNIIDTYFVSKIMDTRLPNIGEYAIHALTLSFPIQMLMIAIGIGTGVGLNALLSRSLGENNLEKAGKVSGNGVFLGIMTYLVFLLIGLFLIPTYFKSQTNDKIVTDLGVAYLKICTIFSFGSILSMVYEKILQATGKTFLSTLAQSLGVVMNLILDPIMIFGYFGCPKMGIRGAAYATVISQIFTFLLCLLFSLKFNNEIEKNIFNLIPSKTIILEIYSVGFPAIIMQSLMSIMTYGINIIFAIISSSAVTAYGMFFKLQQFVFFAAYGLNNAIIPIVAYNYGSRNKKRIVSSIKYGLIFIVFIMTLGSFILQIFANDIVNIFKLSNETKKLLIKAIRIVSLSFPLAGCNIIFQGVFQAFSKGFKSLLISLVRLILVPLPLSLIIVKTIHAESLIWIIFLVAELFGLLLAISLYIKTKKHIIEGI